MSAYSLTPLAKADVFDIWRFIVRDSEESAYRVEQAIYDACALLAEEPRCGHLRRDLTREAVRFWTLTRFPNYTVVYYPETVPLQVVAVLQGGRNIRRILKQRL